MKTNNNENVSSNKKLLIICGTFVIVTILFLAGILVLKNKIPKAKTQTMDNFSDYEMTFEDFTFGVKEDQDDEVMKELRSLYDEYLEANKNGNEKSMIKVFEKLSSLDIYDEDMMNNMEMIELTPEELEELDPDGDGVIYFDEGELPEGVEIVGGN